MATPGEVDWDAIIRDPRFQSLHKRQKQLSIWADGASRFAYYFLLPIGAAYFQDRLRCVSGASSTSGFFALSQFVVTWAIAIIYSRKASRDFDRMAAELSAEFAKPGAPTSAELIINSSQIMPRSGTPGGRGAWRARRLCADRGRDGLPLAHPGGFAVIIAITMYVTGRQARALGFGFILPAAE